MVSLDEIVLLPVTQRMKLVEDIWDSIASTNAGPEATDEQSATVRQRVDEYHADPDAVSDWDITMSQLRQH